MQICVARDCGFALILYFLEILLLISTYGCCPKSHEMSPSICSMFTFYTILHLKLHFNSVFDPLFLD